MTRRYCHLGSLPRRVAQVAVRAREVRQRLRHLHVVRAVLRLHDLQRAREEVALPTFVLIFFP